MGLHTKHTKAFYTVFTAHALMWASTAFAQGGGATVGGGAGAAAAGESAPPGANDNPFLFTNTPIRLLQPPDDATYTLPSEPGLGTFFTYFNLAWPWIIGTAAGVAVLQALIGGMMMMLSGGDSGKREEGKSKLMWAIAGLLLIGLSGVILETLNPLFYRQV